MNNYDEINDKDLFWLAGWLEGEGCFSIYRNYRTKCPVVMAGSTDFDVISKVAKLFGVGVQYMRKSKPKKETYKPMYYTRVTSAKAKALMLKVLPLMGERRSARIKEVIELYDTSKAESEKDLWATRKRLASIANRTRSGKFAASLSEPITA